MARRIGWCSAAFMDISQRLPGQFLGLMNTFIRQKTKDRLKTKKEKYSINDYGEQSALNCSYTALTAAWRGPNTRRKQSSAE